MLSLLLLAPPQSHGQSLAQTVQSVQIGARAPARQIEADTTPANASFKSIEQPPAPTFDAPHADLEGADFVILAPPLPSSTDLVVDMESDRVWGLVGAGDGVTIAVDGVQMGAALADDNGFFWTTLYGAGGERPRLAGGENVVIYQNGTELANLTLRTVTGELNPLTDVVAGTIGGSGHPLSITLYAGNDVPGPTTYSHTVSTDGSGAYSEDFSGAWDFFADESVVVAYVESGVEVYRRVYSYRTVVQPFPFAAVVGWATPDQAITVTVYSDTTTMRDQVFDTTDPLNGRYRVEPTMQTGDTVVVAIADGSTLTRTVDTLWVNADAQNDRVTGNAEPGDLVRGRTNVLTAMGWQGVQTSTVADASGAFTMEFGALGDLLAGTWAGAYVADAEGDDLNLWAPTALVEVDRNWNEVRGRAPAPPGHMAQGHPITLTLYRAGSGTVETFSKGADWYGSFAFNPDDGLPDIVAGDVVTVESQGYGWLGVVDVMTMSVHYDTALNRIMGAADDPGSTFQVRAEQWDGWSDQILFPVGGMIHSLTHDNPFTVTTTGFDVRNAVEYRVNRQTADENHDQIYGMVDIVRVWPQYGGVLGTLGPAGTAFTLTLRDGGGTVKDMYTGVSMEPLGSIGWSSFQNASIEAGDTIQAESAAGFSQTVEIPGLDLAFDEANDLLSGSAPANSLVAIEVYDHGRGFVPTDGDGNFTIKVGELQELWNSGDLEWGQTARICYQDANANHVCQNFDWPTIIANYTMDNRSNVWGRGAEPGSTLLLTITDESAMVVATGSTPAGSGEQGPTGYQFDDLPDGSVRPHYTVTVDFSGGVVDSMRVVSITAHADADTDIVTGTAPANSVVNLNVDCAGGGCWSNLDNVQVDANGFYTADFGTQGNPPHDIRPGDEFNVHNPGYHNHETQYSFYLPAPNLWVEKYTTQGDAAPGGTYLYQIRYGNDGSGLAENVVITDAAPTYGSYAADTSGFPVDDQGGVFTWTVGDLEPGENGEFYVALSIGAGASGSLDPNCVTILPYEDDTDPGNNQTCSGPANVNGGSVDLWVNKRATPGDPHPGSLFFYEIDYGNNGNVATGEAWLTDTLPVSTTFKGWEESNGWGALWTPVVTTGGQVAFHAPAGIPGNMGGRIRLALRLKPDAQIGTQLENHVVIATAGDTDPNNDSYTDTNAWVGGERYDMETDKWFNGGTLVPGGELYYGVRYENRGNVATHAWLTDTLPVSTTYRAGSAGTGGWGWWQPFEPTTVTDEYLVWDLGMVEVGESFNIDFTLDVDPAASPGAMENCVAVAGHYDDSDPSNDSACVANILSASGPNMRVVKSHQWHDNYGRLEYRIQAYNVGDQTLHNVRITDTYPISTAFNGDWDGESPWPGWGNQQFWQDAANRLLIWELENFPEGAQWNMRFSVNLDAPNTPMRWYTNTVEVTEPDGDPTPADNSYTDVAFSGGEVQRVGIDVHGDHIWVEVPNGPITITTHSDQGTEPNGGHWDWNASHIHMPGDVITVEAGSATNPVIITVPDPFDAQANSQSDQVTGQVDHLDGEWLRVSVDGQSQQYVQTDASGYFTATFDDIPRGAQGDLNYDTAINYAEVHFHRRFSGIDVTLNINYGHDWIEGNYEAGHTLWITITEGSGPAIRATAELTTGVIPWWGGSSGFSTNIGDPWSPEHPDIQAGDWVYATMDNGLTATVQLGTITGNVDADADTVAGNIYANWLPGPLDAQCSVWEENGPSQNFTVNPNGGAYSCDFSSEWDVLPNQQIGVQYWEPDGHQISNAFYQPTPNLHINKWADGNPASGSNFSFRVQYWNDGEADAENVVITDTLQGMTYLTDTSGFAHTGSGSGPIAWNLGTVPAGADVQFDVFVSIDVAENEWVTNTVEMTTTTGYEQGDPGELVSEWTGQVVGSDTDLNLGKWAWTGDPARDTDVVFTVNICNNGSTASSEATLSDTLHPSMTLQTWWAQDTGWVEQSSGPQQLVLTRPSLPGNWWCGSVYVRAYVSADAWVGLNLTNTAVITASNDYNPGDNTAEWGGGVSEPHTNLNIQKQWNWGQLVPGGELRYNINYGNDGNQPVAGTIRITETLPVDTGFRNAWSHEQQQWIVPVYTGTDVVVWELNGLDNGYGGSFEVTLDVDGGASPGTVLTNTAEIQPQPDEDSYDDNTSTWVEMLYDHGPNLRVRKDSWWHDWGSDTRQIQYQIVVENVGDETVNGVTITDTYPAEMYLNGGIGVNYDDQRWWNWGDDPASHSFTATFESLDAGQNAYIDAYVITDTSPIPEGLVLTNTVVVNVPTDDVNPDDNVDMVIDTTGPDLYVTKELVDGLALPGELITFSLSFGNGRQGWMWWWNMDGNAWVTDTLPAELEFVTSTLHWGGPQGEWSPIAPSVDGQDYGWMLWPMATGEWNEIYLTVRITDTATGIDAFTNLAEIASDQPGDDREPYVDDNADSYAMAIDLPYFELSKAYESSAVAGTPITYTLTVTNLGNGVATGVILSDTIPDGVTDVGGSVIMPWVWWSIATIPAEGGVATRSFDGVLPCSTGDVVNDEYLVSHSDQGVTSGYGPALTTTVVAPALTAAFDQSASSVLVDETVYFTDTSTTDGPAVAAWAWDFGDGSGGSGSSGSHAYTSDGTFTVTLTVTDTCGFVDVATSTVTVNAPALAASFDQSAASVVVGSSVLFTDTSTTDGPAIAAWAWDFGDGSAIVTTQDAAHTYNAEGTFTVTLTVTDSLGYSDSAAGTVDVNAPALVAAFDQSAANVLVGSSVLFTDTSTTDGPAIAAWAWDFGDGSAIVTTQNAAHAYSAEGTFTVTLTVTDSLGYSDSAAGTVDVSAAILTASFDQSASNVVVSNTVTFTDTSVATGASVAAWAWDFGDGSGVITTQHASHLYLDDGSFEVTLTVTDTLGQSDVATGTVTVSPPALVAAFDQSASTADIGATITFTDTSTTDVPPIAAWAWDFGDGSAVATTQHATHAYSSDGTFTVTLTITDTLGYVDTATGTVTIEAAGTELYLPIMMRES